MNKNQRLDIISRILTLPFIDYNFFSIDTLCLKAVSYYNLLNSSCSQTEREDLKKKYSDYQKKIIDHIASITPAERLDDILQVLNFFYPDTELIRYFKSQRKHSIDSYYIKRIFDISKSLVTLRNGKISIRMWANENDDELFNDYSGLSKIEIWSTLSRIMTPDIFIAAYFVNARLDNVNYLSNVPSNLFLCDIPLAKILEKGIAETHLHFNAGLSYLSLWEIVTDFTGFDFEKEEKDFIVEEYKDFPQVYLAGLLRLLMATYLQKMENEEIEDMLDFYNMGNLIDQQEGTQQMILNTLITVLTGLQTQDIIQLFKDFYKNRLENITYLKKTYHIEDNTKDWTFDLLGRSSYRSYAHLNTSFEIVFLYKALFYIQQNKAYPQFTHIFLQYLRIKNKYFQDKMQSPRIKGLEFFLNFYQNATSPRLNDEKGAAMADIRKEAFYLAIFKEQGRCPNIRKLELKISPPDKIKRVSLNEKTNRVNLDQIKSHICKKVLGIFTSYLRYLDEMLIKYIDKNISVTFYNEAANEVDCYENIFGQSGKPDKLYKKFENHDASIHLDKLQDEHIVSTPNIGLVYHFIKRDDMDRCLGDICWLSAPNDYFLTSNYTEVVRKRHMEFWDALNEMIRDIPYLGEYIVGIDAASDEINTEPWIFAPVFRHIRSKRNTYPVQLKSNLHIQNIGLTYHVGEDYRHILSGLRYIDEVITYFGYKAGDRLGHALALQVNIRSWITNNEVVAIPIMEYLENLLWLWYLNNQYPEIKNCTALDLDKKIMDTAKQIYRNITGLSPYILWKAYTLKFESLDKTIIGDMRERNQEAQTACNARIQGQTQNWQFCEHYPDGRVNKEPVEHVWDEDKLLSTHYCPIYTQCYSKPIFVKTSQKEIELLISIQECLKKKLQLAGIYVETNPTSNTAIGDIDGLLEHPILNLNSKYLKEGSTNNVLLSINSDDPLVFNTNVENEIANVYHMLANNSCSREDVLTWIDKVRQNGLDSSFIRHIKKPSVQRIELLKIVEYLEKQIGVKKYSRGI